MIDVRSISSNIDGRSELVIASTASELLRRKVEKFRNPRMNGSTLAPKSVSTLANCGSTKVRKNSSTQAAAPSTNSG